MPNPAIATASVKPVCLACGIIKKSGKMSCCGHGGSWFENCGNAANANFGHTWYEGIRGCEAGQFRLGVGQQLHASEPKSSDSTSRNGSSINMHAKTITETAHMSLSMSDNTSARMSAVSPITVSENKLVITDSYHAEEYDAGGTIANVMHETTSEMLPTPVYKLHSKPTISQVNRTIVKLLLHSTSTDVFMTTLFHTSVNAKIAVRAVSLVNIVLTTVCWF